MEALAKELQCGIDIICGTFYFHKDENVLLKAMALTERIEEFCGSFLRGNIYGMEEMEYQGLKEYVLGVLEDFLKALDQRDTVYMLDTLDYGLRELINIYIDETEEPAHE